MATNQQTATQNADTHFARIKQLYPKMERIALISIVVANIVKFLSSIDTINEFIRNTLGFSISEYIYYNLRTITMVVLLVSYALAFYWIYQRYVFTSDSSRKTIHGFGLALAAGCAFLINSYFLPRPASAKVLIPEKEWIEEIFASQAENGGFRGQARNTTAEPQVWTTAQCLKAVLSSGESLDQTQVRQIRHAFDYIEKARHDPPAGPHAPEQYEEGWGLFEFKRKSVTEIAGWVTLSYIAAVDSRTKIWSDAELPNIVGRIERDLRYLHARQDETGGWRPIIDYDPSFNRTYSTAIAVWTFTEARKSPPVRARIGNIYDISIARGVTWLLNNYNNELLGWVPNPNRRNQKERFVGLTAQVIFILTRAESINELSSFKGDNTYLAAKRNFIKDDTSSTRFVCSNERIHDFDLSFNNVDFTLEGSTFLWFPWTFAALTHLSNDESLTPAERRRAAGLRESILNLKVRDLNNFVKNEFMYVLAENLFCLSVGENITSRDDKS